MKKICTLCNHEKPLTDFERRGSSYRNQCKECRSIQQKKRYESCPQYNQYVKNKSRSHHFKTRYGLSCEEVESMIISRNSECDICHKKIKKLHVDHCHTTGEVRGRLCVLCNTAIGKFKDDIGLLQNAIKYLEKHNKIIA